VTSKPLPIKKLRELEKRINDYIETYGVMVDQTIMVNNSAMNHAPELIDDIVDIVSFQSDTDEDEYG